MSTQVQTEQATERPSGRTLDQKLEVVVIPVSDVDRATEFYKRLGWRQDVTPPGSGVVQFTPPGSWCSVHFGKNLTPAAPGSAKGYLIVSDIEATRRSWSRPASRWASSSTSGPRDRRVVWIPNGAPTPRSPR